MTSKEQLKEWLNGNPIHNTNTDECCPDFSCCTGKIATLDERKRFCKAVEDGDEKTKMEMLMMFLGSAFADKNIYVAGSEANYHENN